MSKFVIENLNEARALDCRAMSAVRGGVMDMWPFYDYRPYTFAATNFSPVQSIGQTAYLMNNTGNNVAFPANSRSTVYQTQNAHNTINF